MRKINRPECPKPNSLKTNYKNPINKKALSGASHGKCMYCESHVLHNGFGDIEHIKPKSEHPELEFNWDNLGFSCTKCNNNKNAKYDPLNPYINPYDEEPEEHFYAWGPLISHKNGSERGELTISDIDLNRIDLIEKRETQVNYIKKSIDSCMRTKDKKLQQKALLELQREADDDKEYSLCIKSLFLLNNPNV